MEIRALLLGAALGITSLVPAGSLAQTTNGTSPDDGKSSREIPEITIFGDRSDATDIPGGATAITLEDILRFNQSDIQRMIRQVPGVSVQVEDGYGLRPNLSIRGTASG